MALAGHALRGEPTDVDGLGASGSGVKPGNDALKVVRRSPSYPISTTTANATRAMIVVAKTRKYMIMGIGFGRTSSRWAISAAGTGRPAGCLRWLAPTH